MGAPANDVLTRLEVLWRKLEDEGLYVSANTVFLAIEEIKRFSESDRATEALRAMLDHYGPPETVAHLCVYGADHPISLARNALAQARKQR